MSFSCEVMIAYFSQLAEAIPGTVRIVAEEYESGTTRGSCRHILFVVTHLEAIIECKRRSLNVGTMVCVASTAQYISISCWTGHNLTIICRTSVRECSWCDYG